MIWARQNPSADGRPSGAGIVTRSLNLLSTISTCSKYFGIMGFSTFISLAYTFYFALLPSMPPVPSLLSLRGSGTACSAHPPPRVAFYQVGRGEVGPVFGSLIPGLQNVWAAFGCVGTDVQFHPRPPTAYLFFRCGAGTCGSPW